MYINIHIIKYGPRHAEADPVDWVVPQGPEIISGRGPLGRRLCTVCGAKRRDGPIGEANERLWRRRRRGNCRALLRRHMAGNLHRAFPGRGLCAPRFSEKIQVGENHTKEGARPDPAAFSGCGKRPQRKAGAKMKTKRKSAKKIKVVQGSGNVFADLGLPHAEQELMKARLTLQIYRIIQARGLTQTEAGKILGIPQPQVSALARNRA